MYEAENSKICNLWTFWPVIQLIEHAPYRLLYEAVFELKEAAFKLDVTKWVPRLTQSVIASILKDQLMYMYMYMYACNIVSDQ